MILASVRELVRQMQILDQVHDSVIATDLDGYIASWNAGAERLHGYPAAEAIGRHVSLIYAPEEHAGPMEKSRGSFFDNGFMEFEAACLTKSGRRHVVHARLHLIRNTLGTPVGILSFAIDTSELERVRSELRERTHQLQTTLDAIPLYVAYTDTDLVIRFMNKTFNNLGARTSAEWVGRSNREFHGDRFDEKEPVLRQVLSGSPVTRSEEYVFANGERRLLMVQRIPDVGNDGTVHGFFTVGTDITESRQAETARLEEERRLREALIAEVHHRVKNSLQGVVGLLRAQAQVRPELVDALEPAITQVLAVAVGFGLVSTPGLRGIVLCEMVREICRNIGQITSARVTVTFDERVQERPVMLDQAQAVNLALVVNELIFNAVKHGSDAKAGGTVAVGIGRNDQAAWVLVSSARDALPQGFDFDAGTGLGTGLSLVRLLLPRRGCTLSYHQGNQVVTARLDLDVETLGSVVLAD
jgi:PAS domain S-box-containing protein